MNTVKVVIHVHPDINRYNSDASSNRTSIRSNASELFNAIELAVRSYAGLEQTLVISSVNFISETDVIVSHNWPAFYVECTSLKTDVSFDEHPGLVDEIYKKIFQFLKGLGIVDQWILIEAIQV